MSMTEPDKVGTGGGGGTSVLERTGHPEEMPDTLDKRWNDAEVDAFLAELASQPEAGCEYLHNDQNVCSVDVVARIYDCTESAVVCENARLMTLHRMDIGMDCKRCDRLASVCWKIVKV